MNFTKFTTFNLLKLGKTSIKATYLLKINKNTNADFCRIAIPSALVIIRYLVYN